MKKPLLIKLLLFIAVIVSSVGAQAQVYKDGDIYFYVAQSDEGDIAVLCFDYDKAIAQQSSYSGELVIPETVSHDGKKYVMKSAHPTTFAYCTELKSVFFPKTMVAVPSFGDCPKLTKVVIDPENPNLKLEGGVVYNADKTIIAASVPALLQGHFDIPEGVQNLASTAFFGCNGLTSISLPASLKLFAEGTFVGCDKLTSVTVDSNNSIYENAGGCLAIKGEGMLEYVPQGIAGDFVIPQGLTGVSQYAFYYCNKIKAVTFPESVKYLSKNIFFMCDALETINLNTDADIITPMAANCPDFTKFNVGANVGKYVSVDGVVYSANKTNLVTVPCGLKGEFKVPEGVAVLEGNCFSDCTGLIVIDLPKSLLSLSKSSGLNSSSLESLQTLIIRGAITDQSCKDLDGLNTSVVIYAPWEKIPTIKRYFKGNVLPVDYPYTIEDFKTYIKGVSFKIKRNENVETPAEQLVVKLDGQVMTPDANGVYSRFDLKEDTQYRLEITGNIEPTYFKTKPLVVNVYYQQTQTTITVNSLEISSDESFKFDRCGFTLDGKDYEMKGQKLKITGLKTGTTFYAVPFVYQSGKKVQLPEKSMYTYGINMTFRAVEVGPTSLAVKGTYVQGDSKVIRTYYKVGSNEIEAPAETTLTGLDPKTKYTVKFYIECEDGYSSSKSVDITTKELELTTLQPKGVSPTCAIVAASTNMSSEELTAGFQWRKYDAPSSLKSSEGYAAIYDGQLEGYLKNLQSTSYYNVRAFYKSAADKYYYGEWVTFDPSDFSFFEPTVHTYATTNVSHDEATVRGYVLSGTDDISSQGFEYWSADNQARVKAYVPSDVTDVKTVLSNGQVMTATFSGLTPETEYFYRAFVTTSAGTKYGEEQSFTTGSDPSGVEDVVVDGTAERTVIGYYDLNGRRHDVPLSGLNIVVYSDGTTEKVILR